MKKIKILTVSFENSISLQEIPYFRGAIIQISGIENDIFHNHKEDGFIYTYPLIQYKRKKGKPMILCLDKGVDNIHHFFSNHQEGIMLGNRKYDLVVDELNLSSFSFEVFDSSFQYSLSNWLPLNQKNHKIYFSLKSEIEKLEFLEKILIGNILSFAKGIGWLLTSTIKVRVQKINSINKITIKNNPMMAFDIIFSCNIKFPNHIGLGKNSSLGYGFIESIDNKIKS